MWPIWGRAHGHGMVFGLLVLNRASNVMRVCPVLNGVSECSKQDIGARLLSLNMVHDNPRTETFTYRLTHCISTKQ